MELREVKRLVFGGESDQVEFKRRIRHPEKVIKEVVAFANTNGGHLFVGVDDDRSIVGLKHPEDEDYLMTKAIDELCAPEIDYSKEFIKISENRTIIHYHVMTGREKPYFAFEKKHHRYGKAFVRVGDRSIQASREIRMILQHANQPMNGLIQYGPNEKILFNYLKDHDKITINEFREISGLDYHAASSTLVAMVTANALKIIPRELEDWYISSD